MAMKSIDLKKEVALKQVDTLIQHTEEVIFRAKTVFPFDFFPDEIIVDRKKVDIIYGNFFSSKEVKTVLISNVTEVTLDFTMFFATFRMIASPSEALLPVVSFLKKEDAITLRRIITGLVIATKEGVDLSALSTQELSLKMQQLGEAHES